MLLVGDKIELIKQIGDLKVGSEFTVNKMNEDGSITFRCDYGKGIMSYDEFTKHFKKINKWTQWEECTYESESYNMRTNYKEIEVAKDGLTAKSNCNPEDEFVLQKGLQLAILRLNIQIAENKYKKYLKELYKSN